MALWAGPATSAEDPASRAWIGKRVNFFMSLCSATAPSFSRYKTAARESGFGTGSDGHQHYKATEIVASIRNVGGQCDCLVSFGTDNPKLAADMILRRLLSRYGSKFQADEDPQSLGVLKTAAGNLSVQVVTMHQGKGQWIGAVVHGKQRCPA
ncbi:hypothetical protein [Mesorhizobium sp. B3-1-7]|uniref:hypothetical protein n=1 Tax=Mesorhizobium sp. B3-1-7 TaxID=2589894 RepID=UPI0015E40EE5|nr:hypothetical protein [Mesorhizobium sp. B3-1-7]